MLNKQLLIAVFTLSLSHVTQANIDQEDIKKEVLDSFNSLVEASKKLDANAYFEHFDSDKFVGLNSDGTNWNDLNELTPVVDAGFNSIQKVTSLEFPNVKISVIDNNTVILVNEFTQTVLLKNGTTHTASGGGTQVWSKHSGQWKLVSVSASIKPTTR
ncbi:hypothetical protein KUC3_18250 [Alteromonas sp. KC3]|uniref:nuclear transport factor 2 family protein n=1 Tax=unclassified Alteromonas TaxID=2614992 RepID=UPI0019208939|nr:MULTISPECIES: nuclear transport factor 2 family protein [unclassified Alteromonas]BCO18968.1 hypothetical protein KUC3_18250 [Alteromonas sp. KC3]BCO22925.1 hypothetical protein KUC14_17940 [Alteromonas sp. KC14]